MRLVLERAMSPVSEKEVLLKINRGPGGSIPVDQLSPEEVEAAETLVMRGMLRRVPAGHDVCRRDTGSRRKAAKRASTAITWR